jgi:spore coat polysaccharide biosynthesis protein SpsF (cytidylyltransferase family)
MADDDVAVAGRTVAVVQARVGSSRLPGKSLRAIQGRPLVAHVLERAQAIRGVDAVVLATSIREGDDELARVVRGLGVAVWRGSELDVLQRVCEAAEAQRAETVLRVTGDCPFLDPAIAARVLWLYRAHHADGVEYAWNDTGGSGFPDGTDVEVFSLWALQRAHAAATGPGDREHVTTWMRRELQTVTLRSAVDWSALKLSVDTWEDYRHACAIAALLPRGAFGLEYTLVAWERARRTTRWRTS